jgi:site-specific DNA recombinase
MAFADELEREKARQRTYDAMVRKAQQQHVTGGRVFGYDTVPVMHTGSDGQARRSHVERRINQTEAEVVRRIFELCAQGHGKVRIAKQLNAAGAPIPTRASAGVGVVVGACDSVPPALSGRDRLESDAEARPVGTPETIEAARDGMDAQAGAGAANPSRGSVGGAHARLAHNRTLYLRGTGGRLWGRPAGADSKYLLPGFGRCAHCNGVMHVRTHAHGRKRVAFYACDSSHRRGSSVCCNRLEVPMRQTDALVLGAIDC